MHLVLLTLPCGVAGNVFPSRAKEQRNVGKKIALTVGQAAIILRRTRYRIRDYCKPECTGRCLECEKRHPSPRVGIYKDWIVYLEEERIPPAIASTIVIEETEVVSLQSAILERISLYGELMRDAKFNQESIAKVDYLWREIGALVNATKA